jgi:hypothetical protein
MPSVATNEEPSGTLTTLLRGFEAARISFTMAFEEEVQKEASHWRNFVIRPPD